MSVISDKYDLNNKHEFAKLMKELEAKGFMWFNPETQKPEKPTSRLSKGQKVK